MRTLQCTALMILVSVNLWAQEKPTIYIDIPTEQKPFSHLDWNASPERFQFGIVTDRTGGHRPGVFPMGIKKLNLLQPEFVMSVGDLIEGYTTDTLQLNAEWKEFKSFIEPLQAPFFYVPGNHDITNKVMEQKWKEFFGVPYYHFIYKDVLFLALNSEDGHRGAGLGAIGDEQFEYIKKTLEDHAEVRWTLVFIHQPLWVQEDTKRWKEVEKLLQSRKHNVFAGHYHRYWKTERNNGKYIALATTGGASYLRGKAYGEFDHVVWVTMTQEGPILANLFLDGIWDENVVTEELVDLVRNQPFPIQIEPIYVSELSPSDLKTTIKATNHSDTQMRVKLTGITNSSLFYTMEKTSFIVEPNDVQNLEINLTNLKNQVIKDIPTLKVKAEITYEFKNQPNVSFESTVNLKPYYRYKIPQVTKIRLDGNLNDWAGIDRQILDEWEGSPFDYNGKDDCYVQWATAYDDKNLYVAIDVKDDDLMVIENELFRNQDGFILTLDARPKYKSAFNLGENDSSERLSISATFNEFNPITNAAQLPVAISTATQTTTQGANIEMAIPLDYLNKMSNGDWSTVRINLRYNDHDTGNEDKTSHYWFPDWNGSANIPGSGMLFKE